MGGRDQPSQQLVPVCACACRTMFMPGIDGQTHRSYDLENKWNGYGQSKQDKLD